MILLITPGPRTGVISYSFISYLLCTMFSYPTKVAIIFIYAQLFCVKILKYHYSSLLICIVSTNSESIIQEPGVVFSQLQKAN